MSCSSYAGNYRCLVLHVTLQPGKPTRQCMCDIVVFLHI